MHNRIFRIQSLADGQGPFQPHLSHVWSDDHAYERPPAVFKLMPVPVFQMMLAEVRHLNIAHGFRQKEHVNIWFSRAEQFRLSRLGFELVELTYDIRLFETENQVLFARGLPLTHGIIVHPFTQGIDA